MRKMLQPQIMNTSLTTVASEEESRYRSRRKDGGFFEPFEPLVMAVLASGLEPWRDPERIEVTCRPGHGSGPAWCAGSGSVSGDP